MPNICVQEKERNIIHKQNVKIYMHTYEIANQYNVH